MEVVDTLSFLLGTWGLARSIEDRRADALGSFRGLATVAGAPEDAPERGGWGHYQESGELRFGSRTVPAWRRLEIRRQVGGAAMLLFLDGRPFVDLDLRDGECRRVHRCGADRYEITTVVRSGALVEEHWRVRGPTKDYEATTTLTRLG